MEKTILTPEERKKYHSFFYFWFGQQISLLGSSIVQFVLTWWITAVTQNPVYLSLGLFLTFLPRIIFSPLAGVLADKINKKTLIAVADGLQALTTLVLIIILWNGTLNIWLILGFNTLRAVFQSFHGPAASTITPMMVPKSKLQKINSMGQLFATLIDMGAVVLGASLYKIVAIQNILWIDIITFGFAIILLFRTKIPILKQKESVQSHLESEIKLKKPSVWKQFAEGIKVIKDHKGIASLLIVLTLTNFLLSPFNALITYFINFTHGGDEWDMAIISILINVGMVIGAIIPSLKSNWKRKTLIIYMSLFFVFLGIGLFSLAPTGNFWWMGIASFTITFLLPIAMTINITIIQTTIPIEKMGRVMAFFVAVNSTFMLIGYLIAGPIASITGIVPLYLGSSILGMIMIIVLYFFTSVRELDKIDQELSIEDLKDLSQEILSEDKALKQEIPIEGSE
jgi:DHA3 family macrolide efflux protein-like MFS transporter